ncbi:TnpV protein [Ruminococcus sp. XPD3002]|uniref:TnpV protein n=1 Tax=Ruminococcus sp. XPD3002 TaxID=1452269 RepID=UPI00094D66E4
MNMKMSPTGQYLTEMQYTDSPQEQALLRRPIGRWGRMWQEWMKTEHPTEVAVLVMEARWQIIPREIDRQAENRWAVLDEQYRRENPRPTDFVQMQQWEKTRLLKLEHIIMEEIVFRTLS